MTLGHMAQMGMLPLSTTLCIHRILLHIHATLLPAHVYLVEEFIIVCGDILVFFRDSFLIVQKAEASGEVFSGSCPSLMAALETRKTNTITKRVCPSEVFSLPRRGKVQA